MARIKWEVGEPNDEGRQNIRISEDNGDDDDDNTPQENNEEPPEGA